MDRIRLLIGQNAELPQRMPGWLPIRNQNIGEQRARALLITMYQGVGGCPLATEVDG